MPNPRVEKQIKGDKMTHVAVIDPVVTPQYLDVLVSTLQNAGFEVSYFNDYRNPGFSPEGVDVVVLADDPIPEEGERGEEAITLLYELAQAGYNLPVIMTIRQSQDAESIDRIEGILTPSEYLVRPVLPKVLADAVSQYV